VLAQVIAAEMSPREVPARGDASGLRALSIHLRALQSFFKISNHPLTEKEIAAAAGRDLVAETRIGFESLLRCAELLLTLKAESARWLPQDDGRAGLSGATFALDSFDGGSGLDSLTESLNDLCHLGNSLIEGRRVSFESWAAFGRLVATQVELCGVESLTGEADEGRPVVPPELLALVAQVTPDTLAADVGAILSRLFGLLELLDFVGDALRGDEPLKRSLPFFTLLREESSAVLDLIGDQALRGSGLDSTIHEQLDGTSYAMRMELRKAFEHELVGLIGMRNPCHVYAKVENAHGLLRDCFQQSVTSVARALNPQFDGSLLFNTFRTKLEQSLLLRRELWEVLEAVRRAGDAGDAAAHQQLLAHVRAFLDGSMRLLMYKDWEALERFADELAADRDSSERQASVHRFHAFVETLFSQVNMRAVLTDHPFTPHAHQATGAP
jgi:hypothetical protein